MTSFVNEVNLLEPYWPREPRYGQENEAVKLEKWVINVKPVGRRGGTMRVITHREQRPNGHRRGRLDELMSCHRSN